MVCVGPRPGAIVRNPRRSSHRAAPRHEILPAGARSLYRNAPLAGKDRDRWFAGVCEELRPDLFRFAFWLARDRQVAEDVVQESLLRAWRSRDSLDAEGSARHWLLTIVRREHARRYERKRIEDRAGG